MTSGGPGAEALGKDLTSSRTAGSDRITGDGTAQGEGVSESVCSCRISGDGEASPSDVRALMVLLHWLSCAASLALLKLLVEKEDDECDCLLARDLPSSRASDQREDQPNAEGQTSPASTSCASRDDVLQQGWQAHTWLA